MSRIRNINNYRINNNYRNNNNHVIKRRIAALALSATVLGTAAIGLNSCLGKDNKDNVKIVQEYYGENSKEYSIIRYMDIQNKFSNLNLDKYTGLTDNLKEKLEIDSELKSPDELETLIENFNELPNGSEDLTVECDRLYLISELKAQKALLDAYLYRDSYDYVYDTLLMSIKAYLGEMYGIEDYSNISVYKSSNNSAGEVKYIVEYRRNGEGHTYTTTTNDKLVKEGMNWVVRLQATNIVGDNSKMRDAFSNALAKASEIENVMYQNDLYDKDISKNLGGY